MSAFKTFVIAVWVVVLINLLLTLVGVVGDDGVGFWGNFFIGVAVVIVIKKKYRDRDKAGKIK
jgi:uncharacterized membrane protein